MFNTELVDGMVQDGLSRFSTAITWRNLENIAEKYGISRQNRTSFRW